MPQGFSRLLPLLATLVVVGAVGTWAWIGLKSPPLSESNGIITTPAGWTRFDEGSFSFYAPKGSQIRQAQRDGLVYGDIRGPNTCLRYSVGAKADIVADKRLHPAYTESVTVVDGRQGVVRRAELNDFEQSTWFGNCGGPLYIGLYVQGALPDGSAVALEGTAQNEDVRGQIETVFKSVRFGGK